MTLNIGSMLIGDQILLVIVAYCLTHRKALTLRGHNGLIRTQDHLGSTISQLLAGALISW